MAIPRLAHGFPPGLPAWAVVSEPRRGHIERVATLVSRWADCLSLPAPERDRWARAVWLHDALRDAPLGLLQQLVPGVSGPVDLLHGPAAAVRAQAAGELDQGVLDAVRYHSVGFAGWESVGRMLYCADFLEPGRSFDREDRARLADAFPLDQEGVVLEVTSRRMRYSTGRGWPLPAEGIRFWNRVAGDRA